MTGVEPVRCSIPLDKYPAKVKNATRGDVLYLVISPGIPWYTLRKLRVSKLPRSCLVIEPGLTRFARMQSGFGSGGMSQVKNATQGDVLYLVISPGIEPGLPG